MLFVSAKVSQFSLLPQGQVEANERVLNMVKQMDDEDLVIAQILALVRLSVLKRNFFRKYS